MSTRTIIEINHDELRFLLENASTIFPTLLQELRNGDAGRHIGSVYGFAPGVRILGQRHHSEPEWVPAGRRPGSFVNSAGILASDKPGQVVSKLDEAFRIWSFSGGRAV